MNTIIRFRFILMLLLGVAAVSFTACEKENIERVSVNLDTSDLEAKIDNLQATVDANQQISTQQWNATMAALLPIGQQVALLVSQGNATQQDIATLTGLVQTLTTLTQGNSALLNQMWATIQNMDMDLATLQTILQGYGSTLLAMQQQLIAIQGDVAGINAQLALIYNQLLANAATGNQILQVVNGNTLFLQQLVTAVGGLNNMVNLVLQNQAAHGATLASLVVGQTNIGNAITTVLNAVNAGNLTDAQILALVQQFLPALNALNVNIDTHVATILAGINNLQLTAGQHGAALATLIANSQAQAAMSQTILNNLLAQGLTQTQMLTILQAIPGQLNALGASLNAWGTTIIAGIDNLGLTLSQQGTVLGQILANTQNLQAMNLQIIQKLDDLQLSVNDLKVFIQAEIASVKAEIAVVQTGIAVLQAKSDAIALQILTLSNTVNQGFATVIEMLNDLSNNLCCSTCNQSQPANIITTITNVYNDMSSYISNHYEDNSTNLTFNQIWNAANNGYGCGNNGGINGANGCQIMAPIINLANNGSQNNAASNNYNWNGLQNNIVNYNQTNNCP